MPSLLHAEHSHHAVGELLHDRLGAFGCFLDEVILHGLKDTLLVVPFLFLTYLLMEFIEHKAADKTTAFMRRAGGFGPLVGGGLGLLPQCGFSSVAANLFSGNIVSMGTLIAVFLATSDEMLPILISNNVPTRTVIFVLCYKAVVAILVGFIIDAVLRLTGRIGKDIVINDLCDEEGCHCEEGILHSSLHHTLHISLFVLVFTLLINLAVFFIGDDGMRAIMYEKPIISHVIAAVLGLIPSCAVSVAITGFYTSGYITLGTMLSGLFSGAGVGILVLFKMTKSIKKNLAVIGLLVLAGAVFGALADLTGLAKIFI
jgi:hypothetical protein